MLFVIHCVLWSCMRVSQAVAISELRRSKPVAIPTETVWGLAARLEDEAGIRAIFSLKKRPLVNPLIIHIDDVSCLKEYAKEPLPPGTVELATAFWPGPLTLVLPCHEDRVPAVARANLLTAGFRVPKEEATLNLLQAIGPLVAPSANLSGRPSATEMGHVEEDFGE